MSYPGYERRPRVVNSQSPVYAIDFIAEAAGKRIATTKRRMRWRWGFSNSAALADGQSGTACRGEEHEIVLVWSVTSGKRQVAMDGQEVHYSASRSNIIDFSWTMRGNHVLKLVAYATPPMAAPGPDFRQYDFFVDGQSFYSMPKVYELGLRGQPQAQARVPGDVSTYRGDSMRAQEEADLQRAIQESIAESRRHLGVGTSPGSHGETIAAPSPAPQDQTATADLLDFSGGSGGNDTMAPAYAPAPPAPAYPPAAPAYAPVAPTYPAHAYAPAPAAPAVAYGAPAPGAPAPLALPYSTTAGPAPTVPPAYPPAPAQYAPAPASYSPVSPNTAHAPYSVYSGGEAWSPGVTSTVSAPPAYGFPVQQPMHTPDDPFAPKAPTQNDLHSAILNAYGAEPPATPLGGTPAQPNFNTPQAPTHQNGHGGPTLSMNAPLAITEEESNQPKSEFDAALKNLVNFDDITAPAEGEIKLTMMKKEEEKKKKKNKSQPLAPAANTMVGSHATLSQIQTVKGGSSLKDPSTIMKPPPHMFHQDAQYAGALVVHGEGPPPLKPQGFGVVHGQGYGYYGQ